MPRSTPRPSRSRPPIGNPDLVLAVRPRGDGGWDCLLIEHAEGAPIGARRLVDRRHCRTDEELSGWAEGSRAGRCLVLIPSAATICRVFRFPGLPPDQIEQALRLQAESHLLGGVPAHRTAVIRVDLDRGREAAGLLLAWPEQSTARVPDGGAWHAVPEVVALLDAWQSSSGPDSMVWADPSDGSVGVVTGTADEPMIRATCEAAEGDEPWDEVVRRVVTETVMAAGGKPDSAKRVTDETRLVDAGAIRCTTARGLSDLEGISEDDAVGGLLDAAIRAAAGPFAAAARMSAKPPTIRRTGLAATFERVVTALAVPQTAYRVAVVAALVALAMPLVAAGLRTTILRAKLPDPTAFEDAMTASEQQLAVYRELETQAWPMMKILGDLSNCMPEAIEIESIAMGHGEPVVVRGFAKPDGSATGADAILDMERRLRATRVFDKITKSWDPPDARGIYEFSLSAEVARPTTRPRIAEGEDFAVNTLAVRRFGPLVATGGESGESSSSAADDAPPTTTSSDLPPIGVEETPASSRAASSDSASGGIPSRGIGRRGSVASSDGDAGGRGVSVPSASPPAETVDFSDAEIAAMSKAEAQSALGRVARARQSAALDDDAKARMRDLFDKLLRRVREAE